MQIPRNEYAQQVRILDALRRQPAWSEVEVHWQNLSHFTSGIADAMTQLVVGLHELSDYDITDYDDLVSSFTAASRHLTELHLRLEELVTAPAPNTVYWVEFRPDGRRISVHAAPLDVGPLVKEHIWYAKDSVILTSATLRTNNSFSYVQERLDAEDVDGLVIDSPFDYQSNTLLYLINDIPEPRERSAYQRAVEEGLLELVLATEGRTLALFTSYAQLRETSNAIGPALGQRGIAVYDQSDGTSRTQLLEGFVESERAVLMGTRSFWEGVDVPGEDLSVLAIIRLPFSVPSDPLFAARSEMFDDAFFEYSIPETILRFRQGFGRLIRRQDDRGVVAIFDRRLLSKGYGRHFIDALPPCTTQRGSIHDLPQEAVRWLNT
jgi:DNA polymerase-3 subunit epsilon/ATP-dependent DNA helicase DinG